MKFILYLGLYFLFIFAPTYKSIDLLFVTAVLLCIVGVFAVKWRSVQKEIESFFILVPLYIYLFLNATFTYPDLDFMGIAFLLLKPFRIIITIIGAYVLVKLTKKSYGSYFWSKSMMFVFLSIFVHALIMAYESFNPSFRIFLQNVLFAGQDTRGTWNEQFRMGGLMGAFGGAVTSVVQATGVLLVPFLLKIYQKQAYRIMIYGMAVIIVYSILVCGRSGFWCIILFLPISISLLNRNRISTQVAGFAIVGGLLLIGISFVLDFTSSSGAGNDEVRTMFSRTFDSFITYRNTGTLSDDTVDALYDMIRLPTDLFTIVLGDASHIFDNGFGRSLQSDIGYIRDLWSMGVFGIVVYLLPYIKMMKKMRIHKSFYVAICAYVFILVTLFFNAKEMFLYCRCLLSITMIVYFAAVFTINNDKRKMLKL